MLREVAVEVDLGRWLCRPIYGGGWGGQFMVMAMGANLRKWV